MTETRKYTSPLREAQATETRERIMLATTDLLQANPYADFSMDEVARAAGVERRTVFRHFASKETLLDSLWVFINERLSAQPRPGSYDDLISGPKTAFPAFDQSAGIIAASLHTPAGRAMRMRSVAARRKAFHDSLKQVLAGVPRAEAEKVEALAHVLYSAAAWETLRDYADYDGERAGEAASWALEILVNAVINRN